MAEHLREQILDAVKNKLIGLPDVGANVYRLRVWPQELDALPSLNIIQGEDASVIDTNASAIYKFIEHRLDVGIEIRVQSTGDVDTEFNRIARDVYLALIADTTQGITGCHHSQEIGTAEPDISEEGKQPIAMMMITWQFWYRVTRADPSAAS